MTSEVNQEWRTDAACVGVGDIMFYDSLPGPRERREERARAICNGCPVRNNCRDHALANFEPFGMWGGLSVEERREIWLTSHTPTELRTLIRQTHQVPDGDPWKAPLNPQPDFDLWDNMTFGKMGRESAERVARRRRIIGGAA